MKHKTVRIPFSIIFIIFAFIACEKDNGNDTPVTEGLYFPPANSETWETVEPAELGWNTDSINSLFTTLSENGTRAFIVLQDGKIALEHYWGKNILNTGEFTVNSQWYWASAGKTFSFSDWNGAGRRIAEHFR